MNMLVQILNSPIGGGVGTMLMGMLAVNLIGLFVLKFNK